VQFAEGGKGMPIYETAAARSDCLDVLLARGGGPHWFYIGLLQIDRDPEHPVQNRQGKCSKSSFILGF